VLHLKEIICGSLDMLANLVTVRMTIENGSKRNSRRVVPVLP
jgi:hypothetical protein